MAQKNVFVGATLHRNVVENSVSQDFFARKNFVFKFQKLDAKPFNACNLSADLVKYMT